MIRLKDEPGTELFGLKNDPRTQLLRFKMGDLTAGRNSETPDFVSIVTENKFHVPERYTLFPVLSMN